jgi:hypothetical protein
VSVRASRAVLGLLLTVGAICSSASSVNAVTGGSGRSITIKLLEVPKTLEKDPRAQSYIIDSVRPGARFTRKIKVTNEGGATERVDLYIAPASITNGVFAPGPRGASSALTEVVTVTPASSTLAAHASMTAEVSVSVPEAAPNGELYGAVFAEVPPPPGGAPGVKVASRVGIRLYLDIAAGGAPKSDFTVDSLQAVRRSDGTPAVLAKVHNTGARALDMRGSLQLSNGPGGLSAGPFPAQLGTTLAPRDTADVVVPLDKAIRGGPWHAVIDMKSGLLERKASGEITFPDKPSSVSPPVKAKALALYKDRSVLVPVAAGMVSLLLLVLLLLWFLARRRIASRS